MMLVQDLNLEQDVIPIFNYTNSTQAELALRDMLSASGMSLDAIQERQHICRGYIQNWEVLENFSYPTLYQRETYSFLTDIANQRIDLGESTIKTRLRLQLSEGERSQRRSQLVQMILFLDRIYGRYLEQMKLQYFPESYRRDLKIANQFLQKLRLDYFAHIINEDKFSVARMVELMQVLATLDSSEIDAFWEFFFRFEAYHSIAKAIKKHQFTFPEFSDSKFQINGFYHPLVEEPVKNSIQVMPGENTVLLTGPNMSGKSTLLKSVGLCTYLAHIGLAVPAQHCVLPHYDVVAISINVKDDLSSGYSHFMAEIQNLKRVLQLASEGKKCFAMFDELFKGTNIDDAQEITLSTVNRLGKFTGSLFFISTHLLHLEEQIDNSEDHIKKCFIECRLEEGIPHFTYRLREGWSTVKIGKILFEAEGVSKLLE
ncbi:MutS-related protein [Tunicatimonas pelagia]|uniref:MutS-related protein n=1 Tax=Tunicatimonas pelagia TaxID=931531 RepID=UPI002665776D|nr:hypothetical protein [Tunicatimonas pelagia]WKN44012.1 hypothetical protein P0M28_03375 [Tunicatimonas pelagia]